MAKFRRPAQIKPEQLEAIQGDGDVAYNSELAHTSAQALLFHRDAEDDPEEAAIRGRVLELVRAEGVDVIAESWVRSPEDSLPGALWRGFLLREWIRRYPQEVERRWDLAAAELESQGADGKQKLDMTPRPSEVKDAWDSVLGGEFTGELEEVLAKSARLTNTLGEVDPHWISNDEHPLATPVTRRDTALIQTSLEFREAGQQAARGLLH
ncbi:hypothetical protein SAMN05421878_102192 [Actinobaculum suis]|uniref:Uncharacterized protein n=1 Tax=Actinobaculum suis TaxID=1657 RepID=A0A1G7AEX9_9ACTO|nr:hypothetical protein [Actinobaculum suis]MDY5152587.1 hypothetical protein [Actinobaculum suis]SDE13243.1 hypothetical protein SAMN05421878_102192 [Actinobaculum suis]